MSEPTKERQQEFMARTLVGMVMHNKREFTDEECGVYNSILALIESSGDKESGGVEYKLRPEVAAFAALMEAELRKHDDRPGWKTCDLDWLMGRLREEVNELGLAVFSDGESIPQEAADVANFAMMIADVVGGLQKPAPSPGPSVSYAGRDLSGVKGTPTTVKEYTFIDRTSAAPLPEVEEAMATLRRFINEDELKYKAQAALAVVKAALSKQGPTSKDKIKCPHCQGSGDAAVYTGISETCETCKGTGEVDGPLEGQRLPCPGSKHQPSPPAEPTAGEPATRDIGKAEAVAYFDDLVSWMRKCPIPLPIDEEGIAAIRALILAPPVSVTREWVVETTREVIHLGNRLVDEEIPYFQRRLRERGIEVGEKL